MRKTLTPAKNVVVGSSIPASTQKPAPDVAFDSVLRAEDIEAKALSLQTQVEKQDYLDEHKRRRVVVTTVLTIVVSIVTYFVTGVLGMSQRYPHLFRWYNAMRKEKVQGLGMHNFSLYQVCTAAEYEIFQNFMNLIAAWKALSMPAANFLMYTIEYFQRWAEAHADNPRAKLTALHWSGSKEQTQYHKLLNKDGWASTGCATGTLEQKKETLIRNWNRGKDENIWYWMLPQPVDEDSKQRFLSVPMIAALYSDSSSTGAAASACDPDEFQVSHLGQLFDGGLCNVAHLATNRDKSSADLFNEYFAIHHNPVAMPSCDGAIRAAATQGGMSGGMTGMMLGDLVGKENEMIGKLLFGGILALAGGATNAIGKREDCHNRT